MKRAVSFLVAAAMVAQGAGTAWAWGRNRCEAPCDYVGAGDCGCGYTLQYKTEYRPVTRTVCTVVPETTQQQITENVVTPVTHEETRERTFLVPTTKQETRQRVVCRLEYHNEERHGNRPGSHAKGSRAKVHGLRPGDAHGSAAADLVGPGHDAGNAPGDVHGLPQRPGSRDAAGGLLPQGPGLRLLRLRGRLPERAGSAERQLHGHEMRAGNRDAERDGQRLPLRAEVGNRAGAL